MPDTLLPDRASLDRPIAGQPRSDRRASPAWRRVAASLAREPLVHFLILGGLLFALNAWLHPPDRSSHVIVVTKALRERLIAGFDEDKERTPSPTELNEMINHWVAAEVLYREGKALGVDRGDESIHDRIAFKLQLLLLSDIDNDPPSDADVRAWFAAHRDRYDEPETVSFYLTPATTEAEARAHLAAIEAHAQTEDLARRTNALIGRPVASLAPSFGTDFAAALMALPLNTWSVLQSREGFHVVRYESHHDAVPTRIEGIYDEVVSAMQTDRSRLKAYEAVQRLRAQYTVRLEGDG